MTRIGDSPGGRPRLSEAERQLLVAADRSGNADGVVTKQEIEQLAAEIEARPAARFDRHAGERLQNAKRLAAEMGTAPLTTLDPALRTMPEAVRRLALEVDGLWGDADGHVTLEEVDRVARYYLATLPFFTEEAEKLLELASYLGLDSADGPQVAPSVLALRAASTQVDAGEIAANRPYADLFREALEASDIPGAPELLRDALLHSPKWHRLSILEHTAAAVDAAERLADAAGINWREAGATMLLHDVGKLLTRHRRRGRKDKFTYWDHDTVGAQWLKQRGVPDDVVFLVRNHLILREKSVDEMIDLAGGCRERVAQLMVVYAADHVGKGDTDKQVDSFNHERPKILKLCEYAGVDGDALLAEADRLRTSWFTDGDGYGESP